MKKSVLLLVLFAIMLLSPLIFADVNTTQINSGFTCLNQQVGDCSSLSTSEQIFTSLATGKCTSILAGSSSNGCWPASSCDVKTTAQAMLALSNSGLSTSNSEAWLATKQITSSDIAWYLQINTNSNSTCSVSYSGSSYSFSMNKDKSLSAGAGSCLPLSSNGYWLSVSSSCYGVPFVISCNQPFTATNLYQRQGYQTLYVSRSSSSASAGGKVSDTLNASCFGSGGTCNYESTLWAALALDSIGRDVSSYLPYLTVMADDDSNQAYLPYAFLYSLTSSSDYLNTLLSEQKTSNDQSYWDAGSSYGPNYDTALALLPLQSQSPPEKTSAIDWLMSNQKTTGCWDTLLNTAFILYSISGSQAKKTSTSADCLSSGNYCISGVNCNQAGGNVLQGYTCSGTYVCCSKNVVTPTCSSQGGQVCTSGQSCQGNPTSASDTSSGQTCCIGSCSTPVLAPSDCELSGGVCRSSCFTNEQSSSTSCALGSEICCVQQQNTSGNLWIWILLPLIFLALLVVLFRKQIGVFWLKVKSKSGKNPGNGRLPPPGLPPRPPFPPRGQPPMGFQRRPMPRPLPRKQQQKSSEVNDVLSKLKEIGK
jgi:hypothetical protein